MQLTREQEREFERKRKDLLITKELLKLKPDERKARRGEVEDFVNLTLAYDNYLDRLREEIKKQQDLNNVPVVSYDLFTTIVNHLKLDYTHEKKDGIDLSNLSKAHQAQVL